MHIRIEHEHGLIVPQGEEEQQESVPSPTEDVEEEYISVHTPSEEGSESLIFVRVAKARRFEPQDLSPAKEVVL